jgi:hypothetical protein
MTWVSFGRGRGKRRHKAVQSREGAHPSVNMPENSDTNIETNHLPISLSLSRQQQMTPMIKLLLNF